MAHRARDKAEKDGQDERPKWQFTAKYHFSSLNILCTSSLKLYETKHVRILKSANDDAVANGVTL